MGCKSAFVLPRWSRGNYVAEGFVRGLTAKSSSFPFPQVVLHPSLNRLPENDPWFPHRPGHHADILEFFMGCFRAISSSHCHDKAYDLPSSFEPGIRQST
jgi:hypothetical protein